MKQINVKPSCTIATIACKHVHGRFYNLTMIMDGEVFAEHKSWCLGSVSLGLCDIQDDILDAFKLDRQMYRIKGDWREQRYFVEQHMDFSVGVRESMLAIA